MLHRVVMKRAWESLMGGSRFTARMMSCWCLFRKCDNKPVAGPECFRPGLAQRCRSYCGPTHSDSFISAEQQGTPLTESSRRALEGIDSRLKLFFETSALKIRTR